MNPYNVIIIIFTIITFLMLFVVFLVNRVLNVRNKVDAAYSGVLKYINERCTLFMRMSSFIEENIENEDKLVKNMKKAIEDLNDEVNLNVHNLKEIKKTKKLLTKFCELINIYPKIGKNDIYKLLVKESNTNIDRIDYAVDTYDKLAHEYNEFKSTKVNKIISVVLNLKDYDYYNK